MPWDTLIASSPIVGLICIWMVHKYNIFNQCCDTRVSEQTPEGLHPLVFSCREVYWNYYGFASVQMLCPGCAVLEANKYIVVVCPALQSCLLCMLRIAFFVGPLHQCWPCLHAMPILLSGSFYTMLAISPPKHLLDMCYCSDLIQTNQFLIHRMMYLILVLYWYDTPKVLKTWREQKRFCISHFFPSFLL